MGKLNDVFRLFLKGHESSEKDAGTLNHKLALHIRLDLLKSSLQSRVRAKQADQKNCHDAHSRAHSF